MSRIGKKPISIPSGVEITVNKNTVTVKGPKGSLTESFNAHMTYEVSPTEVVVKRPDDTKLMKMMHGTTRALLANMVKGVSEGFEKVLEIQGIGYKAEMNGKNLVLHLGHSHPDTVVPVEGVSISCASPTEIHVTGIDAQKVGQTAAVIRAIRKPEPYHGKGVRYRGEHVAIRVPSSKKKDSKK